MGLKNGKVGNVYVYKYLNIVSISWYNVLSIYIRAVVTRWGPGPLKRTKYFGEP